MCTGKCSRIISFFLFPLVAICILCNIILFFPGWSAKYAKEGHLTEEVKYMGGLVGGGVMVLLPAIYISCTGEDGCCGNRCGMFLSILFAAEGVAGAIYSLVVASYGLHNGPLCFDGTTWTTPFKGGNATYLNDKTTWGDCVEPKNVVKFNSGLFSTLLVTNLLQGVLLLIQMINGLIGCLCGVCKEKRNPPFEG